MPKRKGFNLINKTCGICKKRLRIINFKKLWNKQKQKYYPNSYCNDCEKLRSEKYQKEHPEWLKEQLAKNYSKWKMKATNGECQICGEDRTLDVAHIIPRMGRSRSRKDPLDNLLGLCPTHHRLFDEDKLNNDEYKKIKDKVEKAKEKYVTL